MRKSILTAAVVALGVAGMAGASQAAQYNPGPYGPSGPQAQFSLQFGAPSFHQRHRILSNSQIRRLLRLQGYRDIHFVKRDGLRVVVRAEDRRNRDWILTVSVTTGHVLNRQALFRPFRGPGPGLFFGFQL